MFKSATKEWKLIKDDPMEGLSSPEAENKEMNFLESEKAAECIKVLYEIDIKCRLYYLAALIGGLRRREALACEWNLDIDWDKGRIYVNRSISKTINGEPHVKVPKSKSSQRFVKMPDFYMDELPKYYRI
ncbi:hypothetical protein P9247_17210 [Bacillus subtilis]|nr:hypothetical protein [Bacillus subtilis]